MFKFFYEIIFYFCFFLGRIIDDDDSEYDSEMDDFIDDDEGPDDYSKHISEIFGYDKSKYGFFNFFVEILSLNFFIFTFFFRYRDVDDDDRGMESTFAQQQREEFVSKKIGKFIFSALPPITSHYQS